MNAKERLPYIRIQRIRLTDFRNIKFGEVEFPNGKINDYMDGKPSILGLYGQNGSGKTSLLLALSLLKKALIGESLSYKKYESTIREGCTSCKLAFDFIGFNDNGNTTELSYEFNVEKSIVDEKESQESFDISDKKDSENENEEDSDFIADYRLNISPNKEKLIITNEVIWYKPKGGIRQQLINTSNEACLKSKRAFGNRSKYDMLTKGAPKEVHEFYFKMRTVAEERSTSFIFSPRVFHNLMVGSKNNDDASEALQCLHTFGGAYLFVIGSQETGLNNMKNLPLMIRNQDNEGIHVILVLLELQKGCEVPESIYNETKNSINSLNNVLHSLIPGMNLRCIDRGLYTDKDGDEMHRFDLISDRNGVRIPFEYESDGIRRIVSFLSMLIAVYNDPSFTLAIDEIDSGIFEYLLGELITIMAKNARGQLIFTSHNLRPLEVLPPKFLIFTSVNPEKRFVKLDGISGNNNLRDVYFRSIVLGGGKDTIYESTDTYDIEEALYSAGYHEDFSNPEDSEAVEKE